jgi:cupin fold WbuC family metalloprotein
MSILPIDRHLLDEVSREAAASHRRRKNRNFHPADDYPAHRLLNAIEPDSYIAPHRHLDPTKDETMVVLRGRLGLIIFDDAGRIVRTEVLEAGGDLLGVDIPHGTWHTLVALEPGSVFFEAKAGPYAPLSEAERASWAPSEGSSAATVMLEIYRARIGAGR